MKIAKKGALSNCNKWRGITLLSVPSTILAKIIIQQISEGVDQQLKNDLDFEKAFDSVHRDSLWRLLRAYRIPQHIACVIQSFYNNFTCRVGNSKSSFEVKTGVRQGCSMSPLLFNIVIDCVMCKQQRTNHVASDGPSSQRLKI